MVSSARIRAALSRVEWRDLLWMGVWERFCAVTLALPLFVGSLVFASWGWMFLALAFAFFFFTAGLRQAHDGFHENLGLSALPNNAFLALQSLLMMAPLHAIRFCHLRHHQHPLTADDVEGWSARMKWWQAIATGPWFTARLIAHALVHARGAIRAWILLEVVMLATYATVAALSQSAVMHFHVLVMLLGNCLTGFFAVWVVHHDCDVDAIFARTQRHRLLDFITFKLLYHFEHHVFPKVPSCHLPELARRIDGVLPELPTFEVVPVNGAHRRATAPSRSVVRPRRPAVVSRHESRVRLASGVDSCLTIRRH